MRRWLLLIFDPGLVDADPEQRIVVDHRRNPAGSPLTTRILNSGSIDFTPPGFSVAVEDLLGPFRRTFDHVDSPRMCGVPGTGLLRGVC